MHFLIRVMDIGVLMHVVLLFYSGRTVEASDLNVFFVNSQRSVALSRLTYTVQILFEIRQSPSNFANGAIVVSFFFHA